jgi:hypothetical protein
LTEGLEEIVEEEETMPAPFELSELNQMANSLLRIENVAFDKDYGDHAAHIEKSSSFWRELDDKSSSTTLDYSNSSSHARILKLKDSKRRAEMGAMSQVHSTFDSLDDDNRKLQAQNEKVLAERDSYRQMLKEMSCLVRSLQSSSCSDVTENILEEEKDLLTPERAIEMTLKRTTDLLLNILMTIDNGFPKNTS